MRGFGVCALGLYFEQFREVSSWFFNRIDQSGD
jgi:hypothetical protein